MSTEQGYGSIIEHCTIPGIDAFYFDTRFGISIDAKFIHEYLRSKAVKFVAQTVYDVVNINKNGNMFRVTVQAESGTSEILVMYDVLHHLFKCREYDPRLIIPNILTQFNSWFVSVLHPFKFIDAPVYSKLTDPEDIKNFTIETQQNARSRLLGSRLTTSQDTQSGPPMVTQDRVSRGLESKDDSKIGLSAAGQEWVKSKEDTYRSMTAVRDDQSPYIPASLFKKVNDDYDLRSAEDNMRVQRLDALANNVGYLAGQQTTEDAEYAKAIAESMADARKPDDIDELIKSIDKNAKERDDALARNRDALARANGLKTEAEMAADRKDAEDLFDDGTAGSMHNIRPTGMYGGRPTGNITIGSPGNLTISSPGNIAIGPTGISLQDRSSRLRPLRHVQYNNFDWMECVADDKRVQEPGSDCDSCEVRHDSLDDVSNGIDTDEDSDGMPRKGNFNMGYEPEIDEPTTRDIDQAEYVMDKNIDVSFRPPGPDITYEHDDPANKLQISAIEELEKHIAMQDAVQVDTPAVVSQPTTVEEPGQQLHHPMVAMRMQHIRFMEQRRKMMEARHIMDKLYEEVQSEPPIESYVNIRKIPERENNLDNTAKESYVAYLLANIELIGEEPVKRPPVIRGPPEVKGPPMEVKEPMTIDTYPVRHDTDEGVGPPNYSESLQNIIRQINAERGTEYDEPLGPASNPGVQTGKPINILHTRVYNIVKSELLATVKIPLAECIRQYAVGLNEANKREVTKLTESYILRIAENDIAAFSECVSGEISETVTFIDEPTLVDTVKQYGLSAFFDRIIEPKVSHLVEFITMQINIIGK